MSKNAVVEYGGALVVAIDGPSGSGKSSVSKEVARRLGLAFLDTGAMYRALTWHCINGRIPFANGAAVETAAKTIKIEMGLTPDNDTVRVNGVNVTSAIREPRISESVSEVATNIAARQVLIARQRQTIEACGERVVVEGRDITTVVAPDAHVKLILTASEEARMRRRGLQLGGTQSSAQLAQQVLARDAKDSTVASFLEASSGVYTVDSSDLDFKQTVAAVLAVVEKAVGQDRAV